MLVLHWWIKSKHFVSHKNHQFEQQCHLYPFCTPRECVEQLMHLPQVRDHIHSIYNTISSELNVNKIISNLTEVICSLCYISSPLCCGTRNDQVCSLTLRYFANVLQTILTNPNPIWSIISWSSLCTLTIPLLFIIPLLTGSHWWKVVRAGILVTWNVLSWSGCHELKPRSSQTSGV